MKVTLLPDIFAQGSRPRRGLNDTRIRVFILILITILPILSLILYSVVQQRQHEINEAHERSKFLLHHISTEQGNLITTARDHLKILAHFPAVTGFKKEELDVILPLLLKQHAYYKNITISDATGNVVYSVIPLKEPIDSARNAWFQQVMKTKDFVAGDYQIGRISGQAVIVLAYPVLATTGRVQSVIAIGLSLAWFNDLITKLTPQSLFNATFTILDSSGTIIARYPNPELWVGKPLEEPHLKKMILSQDEGSLTVTEKGRRSLCVFKPLNASLKSLKVMVDIPERVVFKEAYENLARNIFGMGIVAILAAITAFVYSTIFITRPVQRLVFASKRIAEGDLGARTGLSTRKDELGYLSSIFDEMAARLEEKQKEVNKTLKDLKESETKFRSVTRSASVAIVSSDARGFITSWNKMAEQIFGYPEEQVLGKPVTILMPDRYKARYEQALEKATVTGEYKLLDNVVEMRGKNKGGREFPVELSLSSWESHGEISFTCIIHDISEKKRLAKLKEDVERIMRHDLKTPVVGIIGLAEMLLSNSLSGEEEEHVRLIRESGEQMLNMIDESLDFYKMEDGSYKVNLKPLNLSEFISVQEKKFYTMLSQKQNALIYLYNGRPVTEEINLPIFGEKKYLNTLFGNLIKNAIEASPEKCSITVNVTDNDIAYEIDIHNQGVIPESMLNIFFEKYTTSGKKDGTGLGNYSALLIAKVHGGDIRFTTSDAGGTHVIVSLPKRSRMEYSGQMNIVL
ncbi:MAG: PAS domain S-box protein [Spirochaetota bacterium]